MAELTSSGIVDFLERWIRGDARWGESLMVFAPDPPQELDGRRTASVRYRMDKSRSSL
jgi:hypothetical protein